MRERLSCLRPERWSLFIAATAWVFCASCPSPLMAVTLPGVTWSAIYGFTGGSYSDESGNGNTLSVLSGSPSFVTGRNGVSSSALQGSTGTILGRSAGLAGFDPASNQLTLSAWIRTTSSGREEIATMGRSSATFEGEWVWGISGGQLYFWDYAGGYGFPETFKSTTSINNGQWHHVAFVRNGLIGTFYVDGIIAGSTTAAKNVTYTNSLLILGGDFRDGNAYWTGQMDDVSVSSGALTLAQVSMLAADASVPGVETGPTNSISGLTQTSVKLMGGITNLGGTTVTNAGFYLNTNSPATNGVKYSAPGTSFGLGSFSNTITGLTPGTSYYYRAFAANSAGTGYSTNEYVFTTLPPAAADTDGDGLTDAQETIIGTSPTVSQIPSNLVAQQPGPIGFVATWGIVSGASGYEVQVSTEPSFTSGLIGGDRTVSLGTTTSLGISGISNQIRYYRVRSVFPSFGGPLKTAWSPAVSAPDLTAFGKYATLNATGNADSFQAAVGSSANNNSYTISFWMRPDRLGGVSGSENVQVFRQPINNNASAANVDIDLLPNGSLVFGQRSEAGEEHFVSTPADTVLPGNWVHVTAVRDAANAALRLYINGVEIAAKTLAFGTNTWNIVNSGGPGATQAALNNDSNANRIRAAFDDVRIYRTVRTPAQILEGMSMPLNKTDANGAANTSLVFYAPLEGTSLSSTDANSFYKGTLNGSGSGTITSQSLLTELILTWTPSPINLVAPAVLSTIELTATATVPTGGPVSGSWSYLPAAGTSLSNGTNEVVGTFVPTDLVTYAIGTITNQIVVTEPSYSVPGVETGPTNSISGLTQTTVKLMGGITNLGGTTVTNAGFYLNTNSPATNGVKYSAPGTSFGTGTFSNTITNLVPGTSYYYQAFAVNSVGTGYGVNEYSFTTPSLSPFTYTNSGAGLTITGYTGTEGNVEIPAAIGGVAVTTIGQNAFQSKTSLTAVVIPNGVTTILDAAFAGCSSMTSITLPNSLTSIGNYAFDGCSSLGSITIPDGLTSIGANAFAWCTNLTSITLPSGLRKILSGTFWTCNNLTSITIPGAVDEIQYNAFLNCSKLASVYFQENTPPTIGGDAFAGIASGAKGYYPTTASVAWGSVTVAGLTFVQPPDNQSPDITLVGANPLEIYKGGIFSDPGATVTDNKDATRTISGTGTVNTATVGIYTLTYTATDSVGNLALPVTRTVNVVLDPAGDEDGDGLTNSAEMSGGTSPYQKDSDNDGVNDSMEIADGTNPTNPDSFNNLNKGLVAYYPFSGNAYDESGNGRHAVNLGATPTKDRFGVANRAFSFDGQTNYMRVADASWFPRGRSEFTFSTWLFIPSMPANNDHKFILTIDAIEQWQLFVSGRTEYQSFECYMGEGRVGGVLRDWYDYTLGHWVKFGFGSWQQFTLTRKNNPDGNDTVTWYFNGNQIHQVSTTLENQATLNGNGLTIGRRENGYGPWFGKLDDIRIYNRALSSTEIGQLYSTEAPYSPPTLGNVTVGGAEDQVLTFTLANFTGAYADPQNLPLTSIVVKSLPASGMLMLSASPVVADQVIPSSEIQNLTYRPPPDASGAQTFTVAASDGVLLSGVATVSIQLDPVNDAPTIQFPASFTFTEDVPGNLLLGGTPFSDVDNTRLTVTLSVEDGSITGGAGAGIRVGGTAGVSTFTGTVSDLNTYFTTPGKITYLGARDNTAPRTLTVAVSDFVGGWENYAVGFNTDGTGNQGWTNVGPNDWPGDGHSFSNGSLIATATGSSSLGSTPLVAGTYTIRFAHGLPFENAAPGTLTVTAQAVADGSNIALSTLGTSEVILLRTDTTWTTDSFTFTIPDGSSAIGQYLQLTFNHSKDGVWHSIDNISVSVWGESMPGLTATQVAAMNFISVNDTPILAEIPGPYSFGFNQAKTIPLAAFDVETPVAALVFTASSSNPTLFPNGNLVIQSKLSAGTGSGGGSLGSTASGGDNSPIGSALGGGSYLSWELVATPATGQSGDADITVMVIDEAGAVASQAFHITVLDAYTTWAIAYQVGGASPSDDSDGDGATNQQEFAAGTSPIDPSSHPVYPDTDGDGLNDVQEAALGTNTLVADTDGDGANDKLEVDLGNSPTVANVYNRLINGSFEDGTVKPSPDGWRPVPQNDVPGWKTTANNSYTIELWYSGFLGSSGNDGNTLAELNYNASGTLYQDVTMTVNSPVSYSFLHRGRDGSDVMDFKIDELSGGPGTSVANNKFTRRVTTGTSWIRYSGSQATEVEAGKTYRFSYTSISPTGGNGNLLDDASFGIDQDGDGLTDSVETNTGTYVSANNTGTNPSNPDSDNDGLNDGEEVITYGTNPLLADTDGDGAPDGVEVTAGTNPKQNSSLPKPGITLQPVSITRTTGEGVTFTVTATNPVGSPSALNYQWYKDGEIIPTGTNPTLMISPLTTAEAGNYSVVVSNSFGAVTSSIASLTVNKATPIIMVAPTATPIAYGQTLAFSTLSGGVANVPGSFAFSNPTSGPATGTTSQNVIFTPSDTGNYNTVTIPVNVTVNAALISSGFSHTLYLGAGASTVTAWGMNSDGRLGVGDMNSPVNWARAVQGISAEATIDGLAAGGTHSLILANGEVYAAGSDRYGQLGQGGTNRVNRSSFTSVFNSPSNSVVAVAAGGNHSLIVTESGNVFACGDNGYGQLGQSTALSNSATWIEVNFPGRTNAIISVASGADHNLAVDENGGVWVWGRNDSGQLGKNTRTLGVVADRTPVRIISSGAKSVAAGFAHSLVLKQDGTVLGFGRNTLGQAGQGSATTYAKAPTPISGLSGIRSIAAGTDSSFAIDQAGQLRSWGYNAYGELLLGYASPINSPAVYGPTPSPIATNVSNVAGGGYSTLAVGAQGVIFGGRNDVGQSGNGPDPEQVVGDYYYGAGNLALTNLTMDLAGTTETLYDQIFVGNGAVTLNGIVNLMFVGTYTGPVYGSTQTFDLIWAKNGIVFGTGYQLAFDRAGYLVESAVVDKSVEGVSGKVLQATVRAVVTAADLAKAVDLARPSLDGVESVSYGGSSGVGIRTLSASPGVEMIYSYERPTGGVSSGAEYFVEGTTYRVDYDSSLSGSWVSASVSGTTVTPLGNGRERVTLRISSSGGAGFLRLQVENPQATGINAGVGSATSSAGAGSATSN